MTTPTQSIGGGPRSGRATKATVSWSEATRDGVPSPRSALPAQAGRLLHTRCVEEGGTTIGGHHLWFSNMRMRAFVQEQGLVSHQVAFCKDCHEELSEQILDNYKMMERFDEGTRFLEEFGRVEGAAR